MNKIIVILLCSLLLFLTSCSKDDNNEPVPVDWKLDLAVYEQDMNSQSDEYFLGLTIITDQPIDNAFFQFEIELNYLYEDQPVQGIFNQNAFKAVERGRTAGNRYSYFIITKEPVINFHTWTHPNYAITLEVKELISGYVIIEGEKHLLNEKETIFNP